MEFVLAYLLLLGLLVHVGACYIASFLLVDLPPPMASPPPPCLYESIPVGEEDDEEEDKDFQVLDAYF